MRLLRVLALLGLPFLAGVALARWEETSINPDALPASLTPESP